MLPPESSESVENVINSKSSDVNIQCVKTISETGKASENISCAENSSGTSQEIDSSNVLPGGPTESAIIRRDAYSYLIEYGTRIYHGLEYIGEIVADLIGLNESRYQWVIDSMDEKDWEMARAVNVKREQETIRYEEAQAAACLEGGMKESSGTGAVATDTAEMTEKRSEEEEVTVSRAKREESQSQENEESKLTS
mmetsp:Transcript_1564/g.1643  ORF Transcript_1564/g.1643 Transcript_1564/m.1643 type:complete len:196 (+) Transcript_1564:136-723(+)